MSAATAASTKRTHVSCFPLLKHPGFEVVYDGRSRIPLYTYEYLTPESLSKEADRSLSVFAKDPNIYIHHQSSLSDFSRSGFDRGHMVPAADQASSQQQLDSTFYLSNICPQNPQLNRCYWARLERYVRDIVKEGHCVEAITGPLFLPYEEGGKIYIKYEVIGKNHVAVPTHFFKFIKVDSIEDSLEIYIIPNEPISAQIPFEHFKKTLEELEKFSGLEFAYKKSFLD